jgi:serine/threonine protein phosphatase 1
VRRHTFSIGVIVWTKLTRKKRETPDATAAPEIPVAILPEGDRIYAIGDIHGRADLLEKIAREIESDLSSAAADTLSGAVFLGDYVDRGPHSSRVLERLAHRDFPIPFVALRGNHEQMFLNFLAEPEFLSTWRQFGGLEALHSFGIDLRDARDGRGYEAAHAELVEAMSPEVRAFLEQTATSFQHGDYFFCHAGVRPSVPLASQQDKDLMWIRDDFLRSPAYHGKVVVHGHTPVGEPDERPNRINIDTGAYVSGRLTCLVLEGESRRFLST